MTIPERFHNVAAGVLELALDGQRQKAEAAMGPDSEFSRVSSQLTAAMLRWQNAA